MVYNALTLRDSPVPQPPTQTIDAHAVPEQRPDRDPRVLLHRPHRDIDEAGQEIRLDT
jgi:hypothetical protein